MAMYNNGFPATYQPMYQPMQYQPMQYQQPVQQPAQQPMPQTSNLIWVQGEAGAKSHLVAPNTTLALWDSETQRIFLKSADAAGMPTMKILNYTIEETPNVAAPIQRAVNGISGASDGGGGNMSAEAQDALKRQIQAVQDDIDAMRNEMETFRGDLYGIAGKKTVRKKEAAENE